MHLSKVHGERSEDLERGGAAGLDARRGQGGQGQGHRQGIQGIHSGCHRACPEAATGVARELRSVAGNQKSLATDLAVCRAYYGYYPQNCSVPNLPRSATKVVVRVAVVREVTADCTTWVRSVEP